MEFVFEHLASCRLVLKMVCLFAEGMLMFFCKCRLGICILSRPGRDAVRLDRINLLLQRPFRALSIGRLRTNHERAGANDLPVGFACEVEVADMDPVCQRRNGALQSNRRR